MQEIPDPLQNPPVPLRTRHQQQKRRTRVPQTQIHPHQHQQLAPRLRLHCLIHDRLGRRRDPQRDIRDGCVGHCAQADHGDQVVGRAEGRCGQEFEVVEQFVPEGTGTGQDCAE